ncbi:hypothetical protein BLOT_015020 [Blomia tropicalis]|nr:hypothetical protein BLOT_015020 [Blomia tropicalis]
MVPDCTNKTGIVKGVHLKNCMQLSGLIFTEEEEAEEDEDEMATRTNARQRQQAKTSEKERLVIC